MRNLLPIFVVISARQLCNRPLRSLLAMSGLGIGVALMVAVGTINHSAVRALNSSLESLAGRVTLEVSGGPAGIPEEMVEIARHASGVEAVAAVIERGAYVEGKENERLTILAVDLLDEESLSLYSTMNAAAGSVIDDPMSFLIQPNSIILTRRFATRYGLGYGSEIGLTTSHGFEFFIVRGLLKDDGFGSILGGRLAIMDLYAAQYMFGLRGRVDRLEIATEEGRSVEGVLANLRGRLPGLTVRLAHSQVVLFKKTATSLSLVLACLGLFTIISGFFLVFNLAAVSVVERQREIGVFRSIGASRRITVVLFLIEALLVGTVAACLGVALGQAGAKLAVEAFAGSAATIISMPVAVAAVSFYWPAAALGAVCGIAGSLLGFFLAALWAAQGEQGKLGTLACSSGAAVKRARKGLSFGLASLAVAAGAVAVEEKLGLGAIGPVADAASVLGTAAILPWALAAFVSLGERVVGNRRLPINVLVAARSIAGASARSAATVAALAVAVCIIVVFATIQRSIGRSIGSWIEDSFAYDLEIASQSIDPGRLVPLDEELAEDLAAVRGVDEVHRVRWTEAEYGGRRITVHSLDYALGKNPTQRFLVRRGDARSTYTEVASGAGVAVSENFAAHFQVRPGDLISIAAPLGVAQVKVVAVVVNYNSEEGTVMMSRALFKRYWGDRLVNYFLLMLSPGADPDSVRREIAGEFGRKYGLVILTLGEAKAKIRAIIERIFHFIYALEALVVLVGLLTVANTMSVSVLRRSGELAVFKAVGMSRRQLMAMIGAEAGMLGAASAAVGVVLGGVLSVVWVKVHCRHLLGWIVGYSFPSAVVVATFGLTLLVAIIAGSWPAYQASRARAGEHLRGC